ncbi:MAG: HD domain-containing protein [Candidatus Micrarchaeota archaeon]|nr:HD domain-containing protein [Candidatus Micrarchaeota archaeon]
MEGEDLIRIRDPLHGTVALSEAEKRVLDSPQMQRLRGVRQLAVAYLVYPGANHTRFEHSIGTLALSDRICRNLKLSPEKTAKVRLAALLHDVGHTAFSHEAEVVLRGRIGTHEQIGRQIIEKSQIADILSEESFSPREIALLPQAPLGEIISSDIGSDRMDYLLRDSHYTGVAYGVIDADRIADCLFMRRGRLVLQEGGLEAAESLLVARFTMFSTVYLHKTVRIASRMLQEGIALAIFDGTLDAREASQMTDAGLLDAVSHSPQGREYAERIFQRRLYKKAYSLPVERMKIKPSKAEEELSEKCDCPVLLDMPQVSLDASIRVEMDGRMLPISACSELVASLQKMQKSRLEALVMCEKKKVKEVFAAAQRLFG